MNIPNIPYVPMIEITIPAEYFLEVPAKVMVIGKMDAAPNPTIQNPIMAGQKKGNTIIIKTPEAIIKALSK